MPYYINSSILHIISSDFEGSPNSVKECLSCNIPIVSTPVGDVSDLLSDIEGSYISKSFDYKELASLSIKAINSSCFDSRSKLLK